MGLYTHIAMVDKNKSSEVVKNSYCKVVYSASKARYLAYLGLELLVKT